MLHEVVPKNQKTRQKKGACLCFSANFQSNIFTSWSLLFTESCSCGQGANQPQSCASVGIGRGLQGGSGLSCLGFPDMLGAGRKRLQVGSLGTPTHRGWSAAGRASRAGSATVILEVCLNSQTKSQLFFFLITDELCIVQNWKNTVIRKWSLQGSSSQALC